MDKKKDVCDEIARVAYDLYERRGRTHGFELHDWLEAERVVMERHANEIEKEAEVVKTARKSKSLGETKVKAAKPKTEKATPKKGETKAPKARRTTDKKKTE